MFDHFKKSSVDWIVVFLGNPGPKYENTRHNVGFMTANVCEKKTDTKIIKSQFHALTGKCKVSDQSVFLMKPQTFMNLSGNAAAEAARFYKVPPERVIVVSDDVSLSLGAIRVRTKGSAGGHNGLKSIAEKLGSQDYPRVKIGIDGPGQGDMVDWVLGSFKGDDATVIAKATESAWDAVCAYITDGADAAMNRFN